MMKEKWRILIEFLHELTSCITQAITVYLVVVCLFVFYNLNILTSGNLVEMTNADFFKIWASCAVGLIMFVVGMMDVIFWITGKLKKGYLIFVRMAGFVIIVFTILRCISCFVAVCLSFYIVNVVLGIVVKKMERKQMSRQFIETGIMKGDKKDE